jgi:uncharacterized protein YdeI (YjbR/CyaY-like superfamily)
MPYRYSGGTVGDEFALTPTREEFQHPSMASRDPRIDAYIARAAPFARPVLRHVRKLVHQGCPEVEETMKWSMPHFEYHGIMLGMAAFKEHCSIGFWKGELIMAKPAGRDGGMGHFGRVTRLKDLTPSRQFIEYVRKAADLNRQGIKKPADLKPKSARPELTIPEYFRAALRKNEKAAVTFNGFSYTNKKEYLEWITEAKRKETRSKRLLTAIAWLAEGKSRNWKYLNCN